MVTRRRGRNNDAALKNTQLSPQVQHLWAGQQKPIKSRRFEAETWNIKTQRGRDGRETLLCDRTTHNYWITTQLLLNNEDSGCQTYTKLHFTVKHWSDFMCVSAVCSSCVVCVVFVCCVCGVCVTLLVLWSFIITSVSSHRDFSALRHFNHQPEEETAVYSVRLLEFNQQPHSSAPLPPALHQTAFTTSWRTTF